MNVLNTILAEAQHRSQAAQAAEKLGLVYGGYGFYNDPKTGERVAKSIGGQLVKIDNSENPVDHDSTSTASSTGTVGSTDTTDVGSSDNALVSMDTGMERLLSAAGGDAMKLRKALVKKFRAGDEQAKKWLTKLDAYETAQKDDIRKSIQNFNTARANDLAKKREKYDKLYPKVNI